MGGVAILPGRYGERMTVATLELDLDLFSGPFDLLLTLILREEVDLLELQLADVVLAYLDHLEAQGELDLETATEFIVLIAALLELKSRLMLLGEEDEELDIEPEEAAEELLARMLDARRYRAAAGHLGALLEGEHGYRFRQAPLPPGLRRTVLDPADGYEDAGTLGAAIGRLLAMPPQINLRHISTARVAVGERLAVLRELLRRGSFSFEEAVTGADRMTVAVTLFALLELYKRGEADWEQGESFGAINVRRGSTDAGGGGLSLAGGAVAAAGAGVTGAGLGAAAAGLAG
jgi:segregation and condensation protein A